MSQLTPEEMHVVLPTLLTQVVTCEARNETIDEVMAGPVSKDRNILILSDRTGYILLVQKGARIVQRLIVIL